MSHVEVGGSRKMGAAQQQTSMNEQNRSSSSLSGLAHSVTKHNLDDTGTADTMHPTGVGPSCLDSSGGGISDAACESRVVVMHCSDSTAAVPDRLLTSHSAATLTTGTLSRTNKNCKSPTTDNSKVEQAMGVDANDCPRLEAVETQRSLLRPSKVIATQCLSAPTHTGHNEDFITSSTAPDVPKMESREEEASGTLKRKGCNDTLNKRSSSRVSATGTAGSSNSSIAFPLIEQPTSAPTVSIKKAKKAPLAERKTLTGRKAQQGLANSTTGRWTPEEHRAFLQGLAVYGREWKRVAAGIPTRTSAQVRSHAQKYFSRLEQQLREAETNTDESDDRTTNSEQRTSSSSAYNAVLSSEVPLSNSVRREAARILAHPENTEGEVAETLELLRERYALLHDRLRARQQEDEERQLQQEQLQQQRDAAVVDDELVAIHVLQGGLLRVSSHEVIEEANPRGNEEKADDAASLQQDDIEK